MFSFELINLFSIFRAFLRDLVESTHLFLKMLEHYAKSHTHLVVQKKKKKAKRKKAAQAGKWTPFLMNKVVSQMKDIVLAAVAFDG